MSDPSRRFLRVWDRDGGFIDLAPEEEPRIDAAVSRWIDSGETRDTLLHMARRDGDPYSARASGITSWALSTPEGRARSMEIEARDREEERAMRQAAGLWDEG